MKILEKLTPDQEKKMAEVRDFWKDYIFSCKNAKINKEAAKIGIDWLYSLTGAPSPVIIHVDSPMGCQLAVHLLKHGSQVRDQVWSQVGDQVWSQVGDQVWSQVWDQVRDQVKYNSFSIYGGIEDYGWVSFHDFFTQIGVLDHKGFSQFRDALLSGIYDMIQLNGYCIVSALPTKIVRNAQGRLHNPNGAAIEFADGYKQYYINGRAMPDWIWENKDQITKEQFLQEQNSDIKGGIYEVLGQKRMMELLGAVEVDERLIAHQNGDAETVTLLKTVETFEEIDNQPFAWVRMICPSTGTTYLQGVEPHHTCALEAMASLSMFSKEEYSFDFRS